MPKVSKRSRTVALLFSLIFGLLGVHNFYTGHTGKGVAQLILTITVIGMLVSAVWSFIDFVMIAAGSFKDHEGNVVSDWNIQ